MNKIWRKFWMGIVISLLFIGVIGMLGYRLDQVQLLPDTGYSWYYWKLPKPEFWPSFTAWAFYVAHQVLVWLFIYGAQFGDPAKRAKKRKALYITNVFFVALHIIQTHIWYDGLAQHTPVISSQGSVIVMLVLILIMDLNSRGLFFGRKITSLPFISDINTPVKFIKKYHGYFIAWALVFTFWYHPTIASSGHLVGFFYMFLLFIQMSMIYSPVHFNKYFRFVLEVTVLFHGTAVAIWQQNNMWPMFLFGFATMAVVTQVYGLKLKQWAVRVIQLIYLAGVIIVFGGFTGHREISDIHQVLWIPIIEYLLVFVFIYVINGFLRVGKRRQ